MLNFRVPTIEEIYNEYHKQTFYFMNGVYPRTIKNYDTILNDPKKKEQLLKFQNVISRNRESLDWKLYIYACASLLKNRFELKILGSLAGNKLYRNYISYTYKEDKTFETIYQDILSSLKFLNSYLKENNLTLQNYYLENAITVPLSIKHLYSGTISIYLYAAMSPQFVYSAFSSYSDDVFLEYFDMPKNTFLSEIIAVKRERIIQNKQIRELCDKLESKLALKFQ